MTHPQPTAPRERACAVLAALVVGAAVVSSFQRAGVSPGLRTKALLIAPAAAGGGWDTFMRESQNALRDNGITTNVQVLNVPGAAGTIGLTNLARRDGEAGTAMVGGTGLVAGVEQLNSSVTLSDVTPVARVVEEYDVIVVPGDSPYDTLEDLVRAWRQTPGKVPFTGGGSFDQLVMAELAISAGIDPSEGSYIPASPTSTTRSPPAVSRPSASWRRSGSRESTSRPCASRATT